MEYRLGGSISEEDMEEMFEELKRSGMEWETEMKNCEIVEIISSAERFGREFDRFFELLGSSLIHESVDAEEVEHYAKKAREIRADYYDKVKKILTENCKCIDRGP